MREAPRRKKAKKGQSTWVWAIEAFFITLVLSMAMSWGSTVALEGSHYMVAIIVLLLLIGVNVVFDMIGTAITSADEAPFVAMAAKRVPGALHSLYILHHTEQFANFCNDIVGDVCGIVSGAAGAVLALMATMQTGILGALAWSILVSGAISGLTVSLKAVGKAIGIAHSKGIVAFSGKVISFIPLKR